MTIVKPFVNGFAKPFDVFFCCFRVPRLRMPFQPAFFFFAKPLQFFFWEGIIQSKSDENIFAVLLPVRKKSTPLKMLEVIFVEKASIVAICVPANCLYNVVICVPANLVFVTICVSANGISMVSLSHMNHF